MAFIIYLMMFSPFLSLKGSCTSVLVIHFESPLLIAMVRLCLHQDRPYIFCHLDFLHAARFHQLKCKLAVPSTIVDYLKRLACWDVFFPS